MPIVKKSDFGKLVGKTMASIENKNNLEVIFTQDNGHVYKLYHNQDCCEQVSVDDICGDLEDIIGSPILLAEEITNEQDVNPVDIIPPEYQESFIWTFYKLSTIKGSVTIRWYGASNGYYSERVDFCRVNL